MCTFISTCSKKHLYPNAKFWVGPVVSEGFYYDIDLGDEVINQDDIAAIEKEMKKVAKEGKKIIRRGKGNRYWKGKKCIFRRIE